MKNLLLTFIALIIWSAIFSNNRPVAVNDTINVFPGERLFFSPLINDFDLDGDAFSLVKANTSNQLGDITIVGDSLEIHIYDFVIGKLDSIHYRIRDQHGSLSFAGYIIVNIAPSLFRDTLAINNISAPFAAWGTDFWDRKGSANFRTPKDSSTKTIFTSSIWLSAYDSQGALHLAANRFQASGIDFKYGPVQSSSAQQLYGNSTYNRVWAISKDEIDYHKDNYWRNSYNMPEAILNWPAMGDVSLGQSQYLANFIDFDNDGKYNPKKGDYPKIMGDKSILAIFNDNITHTETGGTPLKAEIYLTAYAFDCSSDTALQNTMFIRYDIRNKSNVDYHDFAIGFFTDYDIGGGTDDYSGCDTLRNSFYGYNADNNDSVVYMNHDVFGNNPPAQSTTILSHRMSSYNAFYNGNSSNSAIQDPSTPAEYANLMKGLLKDGTPMKVGGHGLSGTTTTKYFYPGDVNDTTQWSELSAGNASSDIRGAASIGPFNIKKDSSIIVDIAYIYARDITNTNLENVTLLKQYIDDVQWAYDNDITACGGSFSAIDKIKDTKANINIYPNPANNEIYINSSDLDFRNTKYSIYNIAGQLIKRGVLNANDEKISLKNLNSGLYFISIISDTKVYSKKFIIK